VYFCFTDVSVSGSKWAVASSPSLAHLIRATALVIEHPTKRGKSLWDARGDLGPYRKRNDSSTSADARFGYPNETEKMIISPYKRGLVEPLGAGSDYTVFLDRLGVCIPLVWQDAHIDALLSDIRFLVPVKVLPWCDMTHASTTILSTTHRDGKNYTLILDSFVMYDSLRSCSVYSLAYIRHN
jgi:hypothetical protein